MKEKKGPQKKKTTTTTLGTFTPLTKWNHFGKHPWLLFVYFKERERESKEENITPFHLCSIVDFDENCSLLKNNASEPHRLDCCPSGLLFVFPAYVDKRQCFRVSLHYIISSALKNVKQQCQHFIFERVKSPSHSPNFLVKLHFETQNSWIGHSIPQAFRGNCTERIMHIFVPQTGTLSFSTFDSANIPILKEKMAATVV